jgi:hypothetical protein
MCGGKLPLRYYTAHEKPPVEEHPPSLKLLPLLLVPLEAKVDISFSVCSLPHFSHLTGPVCEEKTKVSNFSPQFLQRYSKIGMFTPYYNLQVKNSL